MGQIADDQLTKVILSVRILVIGNEVLGTVQIQENSPFALQTSNPLLRGQWL